MFQPILNFTAYVYDRLKMGQNLEFSEFEILANVWVLTTNFKPIAICFYQTLIINF